MTKSIGRETFNCKFVHDLQGADCLLRNQLIFASCPAVSYTCPIDRYYGPTSISANVKEQLGYDPLEFTDNPDFWLSRIHPDDRSGVLINLAKLSQQEKYVHEYRFLHKNGTYRWIHDEQRLVKNGDGTPIEIVGSWLDITGRKVLEKGLRKSQVRFDKAQRVGRIGHWKWNIGADSCWCSRQLHQILGLDPYPVDFTYEYLLSLVHSEDRNRVDKAIKKTIPEGSSCSLNFRIVRPDGYIIDVHLQTEVVSDGKGKCGHLLGTVFNISELKLIEQELKENKKQLDNLFCYDQLTGLPNKKYFQDRFTRAARRTKLNNSPISLFLLDIDLLKKINNTLGRSVGDQLLKKVAQRLCAHLRFPIDAIARFGGDEFVILVEGVQDMQHVTRIAQRILSIFEESFVIDEHDLHVSGCVGVITGKPENDDIEILLAHAGIATYAAKKKGNNSFQFYCKEMDDEAHEMLVLENDLYNALKNNEFTLHYQPKISLTSGDVIGAEALARWQHPVKGLIPPKEFIPLAEQTGLIIPLGKWILKKACGYAGRLQKIENLHLKISVNISVAQLREPGFLDLISDALDETGLQPSQLELEITESIAMEDDEEIISTLKKIRNLGVCLAIDDFGTGFSSLTRLKNLPITILKIDRTFVTEVAVNTKDSAIIEAIVLVAQKLGIDVVAEGIETKEQKQVLSPIGCGIGQGFLFSRPLPENDFLDFVTRRTGPPHPPEGCRNFQGHRPS
ncbi:sensor domain-containing protein [Desulforhopalus singaporensis]|uniref:PAS domain S-box-containing protein/diguanylate cyclase (GGDEF) domain-containing protein n=1 Tax=Desulforhopalus singaporensis TaxID=91360 RepID=A0A1H0VEX1_9BACT|nr:GGDEF domain-containing phosphodiesterase [Desulforhopalus singaporensis]SDP76636.1 PAS domain S-box-containing protein/diguanylate cyclase (GGDEF) domain-containing protein [Desulforhopalus singaporensis]